MIFSFIGFHGVDCSLHVCPSGRAWVDLPSENNVAHGNFTECSNMGKFINTYTYTYSKDNVHLYLYEYYIHTIGKCNRKTGDCECNKGYTGAACERLLCPVGVTSRNAIQPCSG